MTRSDFIKSLGLSALFGLSATANAASGRKIALFSGAIAGLQYHDLKHIYHHLREGAELMLVREPENRYDKNAIAIYFRNFKLGYVPRKDNRVLAKLMDSFFMLKADVLAVKHQKLFPPDEISIRIFRG